MSTTIDHLRRVVKRFNSERVEFVLFAEELHSWLAQ